jgi:hypothetical protein
MDIQGKIHLDFEEDYDLVITLMSDWFKYMTEYYKPFEGIRIARCIIYSAGGDLNKLDYAFQLAKRDWRDVIVAAEYNMEDLRVRDFNNPFE